MYPLLPTLIVVLLFGCGQDKNKAEAEQQQTEKPLAKPIPRRTHIAAYQAVADTGRPVPSDSTESRAPVLDTLAASKALFLDVEAAPSEREEACRRIITAGADGHVFLAESYPARDNHVVIRNVLNEMAERRDGRAIPLAIELFKRVEGEERIDFEVMLLRFGEASVEPLLELLDAEDWHLVNRAMDALGKLKSTRAVEPIMAKLGDGESWVQIEAAHSLGDIGDRRAIPALMAVLKSRDHNVVSAGLIGLGKLRAHEAFEACMELTRHAHPLVRAVAASTLGKIGNRQAVARLTELLKDEDKGVADRAQKALEELERQEERD